MDAKYLSDRMTVTMETDLSRGTLIQHQFQRIRRQFKKKKMNSLCHRGLNPALLHLHAASDNKLLSGNTVFNFAEIKEK